MKSIKQIRELEVQLSENVESSGDVRKLTALVRAGLFDSNKLTMLKRALNKENVKMTRVEREALLELLDRLLTVVLANQGTFQKVKQSIQEEVEEPTEEELNEASKVDLDINQIPPIIILKRRAIRVFPDGQKVALYWADRINKYISVPYQSIGISEEVLDEKKNKNTSNDTVDKAAARYLAQRRLERIQKRSEYKDQVRSPIRAGVKAGKELSGSTIQKVGYGMGYALGSAIKGAASRSKIFKTLASRSVGMARKRAILAARKNAAQSGEVKQMKKANVAAMAGVGHAENFRHKLAMIREEKNQQLDEFLGAALGAVARGAGALARGALGYLGSQLLKKGKNKKNKGNNSGQNKSGQKADYTVQRPDSPAFKGTSTGSVNPYAAARQRAADIQFSRQQQENYNMIKSIAEGTETKEMKFIDGSVELTPSVAAKIVETYNALNSENKKIVQEMINKDKNSFMKFANFASGK